jgi:hypothetical protein
MVEAVCVVRAGGGGGMRWPKLMVVAVLMHVVGGSTHVSFGLISSKPVQGGEMQ